MIKVKLNIILFFHGDWVHDYGDWLTYFFIRTPCILRMGKKDGFNNELTKKLHDVGTAVMRRAKLNVHENVLGYNEDEYLKKETGFECQKAELPV